MGAGAAQRVGACSVPGVRGLRVAAAVYPVRCRRDDRPAVVSAVSLLLRACSAALRLYERKGLLEPTRTTGGTRRYSDTDIARLRRIGVLINDGINLTGIARVLGLEADNAGLRTRNAALLASNTKLTADTTAGRSPHRQRTG